MIELDDLCANPNIQYSSRVDGIKAHAEDYSFNIESELFNQLNEEQQKLWRKEIEQAVISGGNYGLALANDKRYDIIEDDVNEAADKYAMEHPLMSYISRDAFINGAEWQKEIDEGEKVFIYKHGFDDCKETLLKCVVEGNVSNVILKEGSDEILYSVTYPIGERMFNYGDKVKMLILKDE